MDDVLRRYILCSGLLGLIYPLFALVLRRYIASARVSKHVAMLSLSTVVLSI